MSCSLVIGGTGLIGAHLLRHLVRQGSVVSVSRSAPNVEGVKWIQCDLLNGIPFDQLPDNITQIIYLAQCENYRQFPDEALNMFQINVNQFVHVLDFARQNNITKVLYASSGGIYGTGQSDFDEMSWLDDNKDGWRGSGPLKFYYSTKIISEIIADAYQGILDIYLLRFFFVYGEGQNEKMFLPSLIEKVTNNTPVFLNGSDGITINPIHVSDAVSAIQHCLSQCKPGVYNVAGSEICTLRSLVETIGSALHKTPQFEEREALANPCVVGNIDKLVETGWSPQVRVNDGIRRLMGSMIDLKKAV